MNISSRTPEGRPNHCPVCGADLRIEPSDPAGDAPCPRCGHLLWFDRDDPGDAHVIRLADGVVDLESFDGLLDEVAMRPGRRLIIDFSDVPSLTSTALAQLILLKKRLDAARVRVVLRHLHPDLMEVFRITRLARVFELEP